MLTMHRVTLQHFCLITVNTQEGSENAHDVLQQMHNAYIWELGLMFADVS